MNATMSDQFEIALSKGNIDNGHFYLTRIPEEFFPDDAVGESRRQASKLLRLEFAGFEEPVLTDIPCEAGSTKRRKFFRDRSGVKSFFKRHQLEAGDGVLLERLGNHRYRVTPIHRRPL